MKRLYEAYAYGSKPIDNCFWNRSVPLPKLPSLTGSLTVDVAVIGAGYTGLSVTSREVVRLFLEQLRFDFVPVFHYLQGRFAA